MSNIYLYDGSFYNLLLLITTLIIKNVKVENIKSESEYEENLFTNPVFLNIENEKELLKYLDENLSLRIMKIIYYTFLSNDKNKDLIMYYFIKNAIKYKDKVLYRTNLKCVRKSLKLSQNVSRENHKLKGFLRFEELENKVLYAKFSPTNNILFILAPHFKNRFKNEMFLIKDEKRKIFAFYDKKELRYLTEEELELNIIVNKNEKLVEDLWKTFFKTVAIKERENRKVQFNFMPKKYWKYITEMEGEV